MLFAFKHNPSRMTFCTNCIEDCLHLVDFVSSSFANVGVKPKFWQSQRNFIAPSHLTCSKLSRSSRLNKLSWLSCCKFLIVIKGFVKHFGTKFRDMKREWSKNVLYTSHISFSTSLDISILLFVTNWKKKISCKQRIYKTNNLFAIIKKCCTKFDCLAYESSCSWRT